MSVKNLRIYQEAASIADEFSIMVRDWPEIDKEVLARQMCRAADSISNNIAEGYGRGATGEKIQFMFYADASAQEARNQIERAAARKLIEEEVGVFYARRLRALSISIMEFCAAILDRDPEYKGPAIERVAKRRAWRLKKVEEADEPEESEESEDE